LKKREKEVCAMSEFSLSEKWDDIDHLRQALQMRLGLIWHHKTPRNSEVSAEENELIDQLIDMNVRLKAMAKRVRYLIAGSHEEFRLTQEMEALEIKRFQVLAKLNGNTLEGYNLLPVK